MDLTINDLPDVKKFYIDDYLERSEKTVLNSLKKDKDGLKREDVEQMLEKESKIKMRSKIIMFLKSLLERSVEGDMKKVKETKSEGRFLATWKVENVTNGITIMNIRKTPLTFYKGKPVSVSGEEKELLELKHPGKFLIEEGL